MLHIKLIVGDLQPLDISGNGRYKEILKRHFAQWCALQVQSMNAPTVVDLRSSLIKPLHASWFITAHSEMETEKTPIMNGLLLQIWILLKMPTSSLTCHPTKASPHTSVMALLVSYTCLA